MEDHINSFEDLITSHDDRRSGFLEIALRKSKEASYYLDLAAAFKAEVINYQKPLELLSSKELLIPMCDAAGVSTKARSYLNQDDLKIVLKEFTEQYLMIKESNFIDELINRYLLTQGDALGGRMRNIIGGIASEKLSTKIIAALSLRKYEFSYLDQKTNNWIKNDFFDNTNLPKIKGIRWAKDNEYRSLYFDLTIPIVKKNIDICLFASDIDKTKSPKLFKDFISNPINFIALGELKGGIDPAGADEHWKTANTSLQRIRDAFSETKKVKTFFIGAAIEASMANEIFSQWKDGTLSFCGNLTKENQVTSFCKWIIDL